MQYNEGNKARLKEREIQRARGFYQVPEIITNLGTERQSELSTKHISGRTGKSCSLTKNRVKWTLVKMCKRKVQETETGFRYLTPIFYLC